MKRLTFLAFIIFIVAITSCTFFETKTTQNDSIDKEIRTQIAVLNKKLFKGIMSKNVKLVKSLMLQTLVDTAGRKIDTIVNNMANAFHATDYRILDEFYTKNSSLLKSTKLTSNKGDINFYELEYRAITPETYLTVLVSKNLPINCCVLVIYGKYGDNWKINTLEIGEYDVLEKTAPEYYELATEKLRKGDTIDAANMITIASEIARPAGKYMRYNNDDDMQTFYTSTIAEGNSTYHFPVTVKQIKTQPQIYAVSPQLIEDKGQKGIYPIIKYRSAINLKDTIALKAENIALQKVIGTLFKGITDDKKFILYNAFNQVPDGKTMVDRYAFFQKLP